MTIKTFLHALTLILLSVIIQPAVHAGVYKWVDENGQVHYGEQPGNKAAEKVDIRNNETTTPRSVKKTGAEDGEKSESEKTEQADAKPAETEKPSISKKEKRRLCQEAKSDIAAITSRGRMREINEKGEYNYLPEEQRQQRLTAAKKKQAKYCR